MVHALSEIRRVLVPDGILIDLRPLLDRWQVDVVSAREVRKTGRLLDMPPGLEEDAAANQNMLQAEQDGWFKRESEEIFQLSFLWDLASEMEKYFKEEWSEFIGLDDETRQATRSAWALGDADSQVRVKVKMLITRWKKTITSME